MIRIVVCTQQYITQNYKVQYDRVRACPTLLYERAPLLVPLAIGALAFEYEILEE